MAAGDLVCVTGASGFIALHLVQQLLGRGYKVKGTVRSVANPAKISALVKLQEKFPGMLELVDGCDLMVEGSFKKAVEGCVCVFHTASPFWSDNRITDPENELVRPAVTGTKSVLQSCKEAGTVKKVVITASFACMIDTNKPGDYTYTEADWNETSKPDGSVNFPEPQPLHGYRYSKVCAEKAAYEFEKDAGFDICTINPPLVIGPNLQEYNGADDLNQSSLIVLNYLSGKIAKYPAGGMAYVAVEDVAKAHWMVWEAGEKAKGRFLTAWGGAPWKVFAETLKAEFPDKPVPTECAADGEQLAMTLDCTKLKGLGMEFIDLRTMLKRQGDSLIAKGLC
jgi:nucleoside-diphosphate-sugar epimerase